MFVPNMFIQSSKGIVNFFTLAARKFLTTMAVSGMINQPYFGATHFVTNMALKFFFKCVKRIYVICTGILVSKKLQAKSTLIGFNFFMNCLDMCC